MNIRSKIMLSTAVGAAVTAMALAAVAAFNIRSVAAIAAVASAFCAVAAVIGLYIADGIAKPLDAAAGIVRELNRLCLGSRFDMRRGGDISAMAKALDALRQTTKTASQTLNADNIEELSLGISEISSMTNRNADIIYKAKLSATEAFAAASVGDAAMKRTAKAVNLIKISSDNNAKIIKMVNYMAVRANFIAFNAAVEAAHTDEGGNGFAFVANEMRNFALRCSMTAKNIGDMIEESAKEAGDGIESSEDTARYIGKIVDRVDNLDRTIDKLVNAASEQAQSVRRVKTSLARMNLTARPDAADSNEPTGIDVKPGRQPAELANTADVSAQNTDNKTDTDDQQERRSISDRQTKYATFPPYKKTFSAATLAFWVPERVEAEEAFTIEDCEMWR